MKSKRVKYISMDISYYGNLYASVKYYPAKGDGLDSLSLRTYDGLWFGIDLNQQIPINVHLFFFGGRWNTNCESCERNLEGDWNHCFDSNIFCKNVKVKYKH